MCVRVRVCCTLALPLVSCTHTSHLYLICVQSICRYAYEPTATMLIAEMDPILNKYQEGLSFLRNAGPTASVESALALLNQLECQLAWLVAVFGAIVGGGGASSSAGSYYTNYAATILGGSSMASGASTGEEIWDAELSRRVLSLMSMLDERLSAAASGSTPMAAMSNPMVRLSRMDPRLEMSFIYFLGNFRKAYINEQGGLPSQQLGAASAASAVASTSSSLLLPTSGKQSTAEVVEAARVALAEPPSLQDMYDSATGRTKAFLGMLIRLGMGDHTVVVTVMIQKLTNNLRFWVERSDIIQRSLEVLNELIYSYSSGRLLLTLDVINDLLTHHTEEYFPFLSASANVRYRTQFYSALARLVFMEDENEVR